MKVSGRTTDFEKVVIGDFISGIIKNIEYDEHHKFKGFEGQEDTIGPAVRFVFTLDGYEYSHRSRWMKASTHEKANLYKKYIAKLVNNATPNMELELDMLIGIKIKTIWEQNGDFQNLESIYPNGKKISLERAKGDEPPFDHEEDFVHEDDVPL